jgi:hypothetical protein
LLREDSTIDLQIILGNAALVHPLAQAFIADELHHANSFIDSGIVRLGAI